VDSEAAKMCWISLRTSIQCSTLNGEDLRTAYEVQLWSDKQIVGLAMYKDLNRLVFLLRSYSGVEKYVLKSLSLENEDEPAVDLDAFVTGVYGGPMTVLHGKAMWSNNGTSLVHYDLQTRQLIANQRLSDDLVSFAAINQRANYRLTVVPDPVKMESVSVRGKYTDFQIVWEAVRNIDYGTVTYDVLMELAEANYTVQFTTTKPLFNPRDHFDDLDLLKPYSKMNISVLSKTKWATASYVAEKELFAPQALPGRPGNVRTFYRPLTSEDKIEFEVRWSEPSEPNGVVTGYLVTVTCSGNAFCDKSVSAGPGARSINFTAAASELISEELHFAVWASTALGRGEEATATMEVVNDNGFKVPPRLIIFDSSERAIKLVDVDGNGEVLEKRIVGFNVAHMKYSSHDKAVYYVSVDNELGKLKLDGGGVQERLAIFKNGGVDGFAYDVFGRYTYVAYGSARNTTIVKVAVDQLDPEEVVAAVVDGQVKQMEADPYENSLYFISQDRFGKNKIKMISKNGETTYTGAAKQCNCKSALESDLITTFALRASQKIGHHTVVFGRKSSKRQSVNLFEGDSSLCQCNKLGKFDSDDTPRILSADASFVYLSGGRAMDYKGKVTNLKFASDIEVMTSYCPTCQAMPEPSCLRPFKIEVMPETKDITDTTFMMVLPGTDVSTRRKPCSFSNALPPTTYTVRYADVATMVETGTDLTPASCTGDCKTVTKTIFHGTDTREVTVSGLAPFTRYKLLIYTSNEYFGITENQESLPRIFVETLDGQPSEPRNLNAFALSPLSIRVTWNPPATINGKSAFYEVHYQTEKFVTGSILYQGKRYARHK
jgi:hypothetical protein